MPSDRPPSHQFALPERQQQQQQQEQVAIVSRLRLHLKAHNMPADREEQEKVGEGGAHSEMQLVPRTNAISRVSPNARNQLHLSAIPCFTIRYYIVYTVSFSMFMCRWQAHPAGTTCRCLLARQNANNEPEQVPVSIPFSPCVRHAPLQAS